MLRGLAFRLRPGAQGVVLVKPQFELPDRQVKGGEVDDQNLRRRAPSTGSGSAARRWASSWWRTSIRPSPVAKGRSRSWPTSISRGARSGCPPRASAAAPAARAPRARADRQALRWFAVVAPGLEPAAEHELARCTAPPTCQPSGRRRVDVRRRWAGSTRTCGCGPSRACSRAWAASRRASSGSCGGARPGCPGTVLRARGATVTMRASATAVPPLPHGRDGRDGRAGHRRRGARACAWRQGPGRARDGGLVRGEEDQFTFSVDASGERLHRRGARIEVGAAPLRETLAAGLLALAGWDPSAAARAIRCAAPARSPSRRRCRRSIARPGLDREFALEDWPLFAAAGRRRRPRCATGARARVRADARRRPSSARIAIRAVIESAAAQRRAGRRRPNDRVRVPRPRRRAPVRRAQPRPGDRQPALRAAARRSARRRCASTAIWAALLRAHFRGWRAAVVVPARLPGAADALRLTLPDRHRLRNGGLPIELRVGRIT